MHLRFAHPFSYTIHRVCIVRDRKFPSFINLSRNLDIKLWSCNFTNLQQDRPILIQLIDSNASISISPYSLSIQFHVITNDHDREETMASHPFPASSPPDLLLLGRQSRVSRPKPSPTDVELPNTPATVEEEGGWSHRGSAPREFCIPDVWAL